MSQPVTHLERLKAERDKKWARVCLVTSTRWDLTAFEKADDAYRAECAYLGLPYERVTYADEIKENHGE